MFKSIVAAGAFAFGIAGACFGAAQLTPQQIRQEAISISKELRCPASLNQSLFDSEKPIASELKAKIYELLAEGKSREEIYKFFADRYGEQIRYAPQMSGGTAALWAVPVILVVGVGAGAVALNRKRSKPRGSEKAE